MLCEHGNTSPCFECDIEPLRAENEKLREKVKALVEALELISDTDPDEGTAWFHEIAYKALAALGKQGGEQ